MNVSIKFKAYKGFWPGVDFRVIGVRLRFQGLRDDENELAFIKLLMGCYFHALDALGFFVFAKFKPVVKASGGGNYLIYIPYHEVIEHACIDLVKQIFNDILKGSVKTGIDLPKQVEGVVKYIDRRYFFNKNPKRTAQCLIGGSIPIQTFLQSVLQIGWGRNSRLLESSVSDETTAIGVKLAGNKKNTADLLRMHGIPASDTYICPDERHAIDVARRIGYPVVVKPADQERGTGVYALIDNDDRLMQAFHTASQSSKKVLVEKHFFGKDYRIQIYKGEAYSVTHREPGGVTGDGIHSVAELLCQQNENRRNHPLLRVIEFDDDARYMLQRQNLDENSKPAVNQFVPLRSIANVDRGGVSTQVLSLAHPDNLALAAKAAEIIRLDIAGIDLLIPDIGKSWKEVGALICEINARPMINKDAIGRLVQMMMPAKGYRIPTMLVTVPVPDDFLFDIGRSFGLGVGVSSSKGAWVNGEPVSAEHDFTLNGKRLLINRDVVALVNFTTIKEINSSDFGGFPCDRYDFLICDANDAGAECLDNSSNFISDIARQLPKIGSEVHFLDGPRQERVVRAMDMIRSWVSFSVSNP